MRKSDEDGLEVLPQVRGQGVGIVTKESNSSGIDRNIYREVAKYARNVKKGISLEYRTYKISFATFAPWRFQDLGSGFSVDADF